MKRLVIVLVALLVILIGAMMVISANSMNIYKDANHVLYGEVLDQKDIPTVYYYYQDTCHFCNSIKDQVTDLYTTIENNDKIDMKLVDVKSSKNKGAWTTDPDYDPAAVTFAEANDIKITGTPTMIYVVDGEVVEYEVGKDIFTLMENVNQQFELGLTFDPSQYGKE